MRPMSFEVSTPVFEGPFDLLLHLILKEEVDLWEISLARIVDAFCAEVEKMERVDLDGTTEFLLIAATLVELKARRLLPGADDVELDEELARFEERDLLLARLLECKTFQDAARVIDLRIKEAARSVARTAGPEEPFRSLAPDPLESVPLPALLAAAKKALAPKAEVPEVTTDAEHIAPIRASVRDAIETVLALLPDSRPISFRELAVGAGPKLEVIVRFLAVLELYKQGVVDLDQTDSFGDLVVRALAPGERVALDLDSLQEWGDEPQPGDVAIDVDEEDSEAVDVVEVRIDIDVEEQV
jgi:segregation and condensation protein A